MIGAVYEKWTVAMLSYYLTIEGPEETDAVALGNLQRDFFEAAKSLPGVAAVRAFQPALGEVAFFDDVGVPRLLLQIVLDGAAGLVDSLGHGALAKTLENPVAGCTRSHQLFEHYEEPLETVDGLAYGDARLSFVVRYYASDRPEKIAAFQRAYLEGHPAALANFAEARRIFCYLPVDWDDPTDIPSSNSIVGNEVVFDSIEGLNAALTSPAMAIVGQHSREMPRFIGSNTHFPMTLVSEWLG